MYYWRNNAFQSLAEAGAYAAALPKWQEYAKFCELLSKGLRKNALVHLTTFVEQAANWPFPEKKEFISWLYKFSQEHSDTFLLIPHPLYEEFIKSSLIEWIEREPENGEPHRWLGTAEHLKEAIRLNPADDIARSRLADTIIHWVEYATHELPYGYIGNASEDLQTLSEMEEIIAEISDEENRAKSNRRVQELRESINTYLDRKTET
jgi:hypothetical protein